MSRSRTARLFTAILGALLLTATPAGALGVTLRDPGSPISFFDLPASARPSPGVSDPGPCVAVPVIDDRCEEWVGPRVDGPGKGPDGPGGPDVAEPVGISPDGTTFYSTGIADVDPTATQDLDMMTVASDAATGATKWTARTTGDDPHLLGSALSVDPTGRYVFVSGRGGSNSYQPCTVVTAAYEAATGRQVWSASEGSDGDACTSFGALGVDPSGERVYLAEGRTGPDGLKHFVVIAYDADDGRQVWSDDYLGTLESGAVASALDLSPDGKRLYVSGSSLGLYYGNPQPMSWVTIAYDAGTGERKWTHSGAIVYSRPTAGVKVSPDGSRVYLAGSGRLVMSRSFDIVITSLDAATGSQLWQSFYNGPGRENQNFDGLAPGNALAVTPNGSRVVAAGFSNAIDGLGMDLVTVSFDATTGAEQWATRVADNYYQYWSPSIVMSKDGSQVYVGALASPRDSLNSYLPTIAFNTSTGAQAWMARYGEGYQYWGGMALSPDGRRLIVVGAHASWAALPGVGNSYDFFSVAYRT